MSGILGKVRQLLEKHSTQPNNYGGQGAVAMHPWLYKRVKYNLEEYTSLFMLSRVWFMLWYALQ
jgi:hypothetical protein